MTHSTEQNPSTIFLADLKTMTDTEKKIVKRTIDLLTTLADDQCLYADDELYYDVIKINIVDQSILNSMNLFVETLMCDENILYSPLSDADAELMQDHQYWG